MISLRTLAVLALVAISVRAEEPIQFNRDVRPILTDACFSCHGPAAKKGGLRLDQRDSALAAAIVAGKPEASELVRRILSNDQDERMPPPSSHKTLKAHEKEILKKWIAQGAGYQKHWAFEAPVKTALPKSPANPIDWFIAQRLAKEKLTGSPEADRPTLIRRVAFTLTGLPPTPAEVENYLKDASPDAYKKMVERYLGSKHYGEEMARHWLDVARYADTHGLHLDNERQMWLYRDWVVKAFNQNMPFDRFTVEQLAGDLLPKPTPDQFIATGFNRCNVTTSEGGSIDSEWVFRNAVDRTSTMTEVWLGLSAGCAVCHDHKFDPISAKEFYSLYAFFYSAAGPALDGNKLLTEPTIKTSSPEQDKKLATLVKQIADLQMEIKEKVKSLKYDDPAAVKDADLKKLDLTKSLQIWIKQNGGKDNKALPQDIKNLLKLAVVDPNKLKGANEVKLREYYFEHVCALTKPEFDALTKKLAAVTKERDDFDKSIPGTFVFKDMPAPRESFVMMRGQYTKPGEKVEPNTLGVLPAIKKVGPRANRLDLAHWLVSPEQPLTARVTVNRFWQQYFGVGLVKSSADFGSQGELPSHPELLDHLAVWFRENNWDVKALTRLMLHSATFKQSSRVTPELWKRDPENRLVARGPRFRLDAEQIRDNALFVSGLIHLEMGGRGVRPYQPQRIWEPVAFSGSNTGTYTQDKGSALYRRSIYVFYKRTAPPPYLTNFDAPNRESSCNRRERSNTPLQALQLMNDVQHFEAARALAERMIIEGGKSPAERIAFLYRTVLSRAPESQELAIVQQALEQNLARFAKDGDAAKKVVRIGESQPKTGLAESEVAAYALIANLVLNLDETVNRN